MITYKNHYFYLETENTSYIMKKLSNGILQHIYYGAKVSQDDFSYYNLFRECAFSPLIRIDGYETSRDTLPQEYPTFGRGDYRQAALLVESAGGRCVNELSYTGYEIFKGKPDYPAFFSYQEPWWEVFQTVSSHIEKHNRFLSEGKRKIQMLVLYPMTSMWCLLAGKHQHSDESRFISNQFRLLVENLVDLQKDFLIITEEAFQTYSLDESVEGVLVPDSVSLDAVTYEKLRQLSQEGIRVAFINRRPQLCEGVKSRIADSVSSRIVENRRGLLEKYFLVINQQDEVSVVDGFWNRAASGLVLAKRVLEEETRVFVVNPSRQDTKQVFLKVQGERQVKDAESFFDGEYTYTPFTLAPTQSRCFCVRKGQIEKEQKKVSNWSVRTLSGFDVTLLEENALTVDKCNVYVNEKQICKEVLPAACADLLYQNAYAAGKETKVWITYTFAMNFEKKQPEKLVLAAESDGISDILVNGHSVLEKRTGWWIDRSFHCFEIHEAVQNGINEVRLEFTVVRPDELEEQGDFEGYRNRFFYEIEPENIYIRGDFDVCAGGEVREAIEDFRVDGPFLITDAQEKKYQELTHQGLWFYRGNVSLKTKFEKKGDCTELCLNDMHGTAVQVLVNGQAAGIIYREPYGLPISEYVKEGVNELELILYGSNRNLLGPHHHLSGNPHFVGVPTFVEKKGFTDFIYPQIADAHTGTKRYSFVKLSCGTVILKER